MQRGHFRLYAENITWIANTCCFGNEIGDEEEDFDGDVGASVGDVFKGLACGC